jgi:hypothetical protein
VFDTECDPSAVVRSLNAHRRHLTPEQKREIIRKLLKATPEKSDRQVAKLAGVSHPHVGKVRRSLEQTGDVETVSTSTDTKGRKQPRTKKRPKVPRKAATHSHQDVGPENPSEIARKLAPLEELESTTRRLERENVGLKSELATLSVDAFIGAGREEQRRFLDGIGLDSLLDAMSADMLADLNKRLVARYRSQPGSAASVGFRGGRVGGSDTGRSRHSSKPAPSSTGGEGARGMNRVERRRLHTIGKRVDHEPER